MTHPSTPGNRAGWLSAPRDSSVGARHPGSRHGTAPTVPAPIDTATAHPGCSSLPGTAARGRTRSASDGHGVYALNFLADIEGEHQLDLSRAPLDHVPRNWRREVIGPDRRIDRRAYTVCVLERLQDSLPPSRRVRPAERALGRSARQTAPGIGLGIRQAHVCRILGREEKAAAEIAALTRRLDETYRRTAANLPTNTAVRLETQDGRETANTLGPDAGSPTTTSPPTSSQGSTGS